MGCICDQQAGADIAVSPACIGQLWVFEELRPAEMAALVQAALRKTYDKGAVIFDQGRRADRMFLIKAGRVKLSKLTEEGQEITLDLRKAGDFLGESMFLEDADYPLTATCLEPTLSCGFRKADFERLVLENPNIGLQVIKNLSKRIAWLTGRVGSLSFTNLEERLYEVLANVAREHGESREAGLAIQFPLTHEELGFLVGAHRVSITKALKSLKKSGKILQTGKTLILL
jgi:CRP/FNR family transcriptional regulator